MRTSSTTRPPHHRRPLTQPLHQDWDRLVARRAELADLLREVGYVEVRGNGVGSPPDGADRALAGLVARAAHDPLAARVVLQRILPGLAAIARRRARGQRGRTHLLFEDLLATGWIVIRCYPVHRRPAHVAANLLRDIEYRAFVADGRRAMNRRELPTPVDAPVAHLPSSSFEEVVAVLVDGRDAGVPADALGLAAAWASGASTAALARRFGVAERTVRHRRTRVVAALRRAALGELGEPDEPLVPVVGQGP